MDDLFCFIKEPENFLTFKKTKKVFLEVACESLRVSDARPSKGSNHCAALPVKATRHCLFVVTVHWKERGKKYFLL